MGRGLDLLRAVRIYVSQVLEWVEVYALLLLLQSVVLRVVVQLRLLVGLMRLVVRGTEGVPRRWCPNNLFLCRTLRYDRWVKCKIFRYRCEVDTSCSLQIRQGCRSQVLGSKDNSLGEVVLLVSRFSTEQYL